MHADRRIPATQIKVTQRYELHAPLAQRDDARQEDLATACTGELDQGRRAQLLRQGGVETDAFAGSEPASAGDVTRHGDRCLRASLARQRTALGLEREAEL